MAPAGKNNSNKKSSGAKKGGGCKKSRDEWHEQILLVLKQHKKLGKESLPVSTLKTLCQYPGGEPSFKNNLLSKLKTQKRAIEYPQSGHVALTDEGEDMAPDDGMDDGAALTLGSLEGERLGTKLAVGPDVGFIDG